MNRGFNEIQRNYFRELDDSLAENTDIIKVMVPFVMYITNSNFVLRHVVCEPGSGSAMAVKRSQQRGEASVELGGCFWVSKYKISTLIVKL